MARISRRSQIREVLSEARRIGGFILLSPNHWKVVWWDSQGVRGGPNEGKFSRRFTFADGSTYHDYEGDILDGIAFVIWDTWRWIRRAWKEALCTHPHETYYEVDEGPLFSDECESMMQAYCGTCGGSISRNIVDRHTIKE